MRLGPIAFRLEQTIIDPGGIVASRVWWESEPVSITANQALAAEAAGEDQRSATEAAEEFLHEALAGGPVSQKELKHDAEGAGLSWATVRRAKDRLGVKAQRQSEEGATRGHGQWYWSLHVQGAHPKDEHLDEHLEENECREGFSSQKAAENRSRCSSLKGEHLEENELADALTRPGPFDAA